MVTAEPLTALSISSTSEERIARYRLLLTRLKLILEGEEDLVAILATIVCEIHSSFEYSHWTGFYQTDVNKPTELVVGPYQGGLACLRIPFSRGVCGAAATQQWTQLVENVHEFPGHIACASSTNSEIVVPVIGSNDKVLAVLDLDSDVQSAFTDADADGLEMICKWLGEVWSEQLLSE